MHALPEPRQPRMVDPYADCLKYERLVGDSQTLRDLRTLLGKFALAESPILIRGESGTGKALVARTLHRESLRHDKPFVVVQCGALEVHRIHAELFGHEQSTSPATPPHPLGCFEAAEGGTLFLQDIDELPLEAQASVLRVMHEKHIERVGSSQPQAVNVRVMAASDTDMVAAIAQGRLRKDLYYRLNVLELFTPPLRELPDDLALLANHFLQCFSHETSRRPYMFSEGALAAMAHYVWPGNVRELASRVRRGLVVAEGYRIEAHDLGLETSVQASEAIDTLEAYKDRAERQALRDVLYRHGNNLSRAAKVLGVSRPTFYRLLHKHHIR